MTVIIDYNAGNVGSIVNMLKKIGEECIISNDPSIIENATRLILPGVGKFDYGMSNLKASGLIPILNQQVVEKKTPILGICLGVQLMTSKSEEGQSEGLGWFDAETINFDKTKLSSTQRIPHMGWSEVNPVRENLLIINDASDPLRFYHVHSYHLLCKRDDQLLATSKYGNYEFATALQRENILGVQFHPEKSHKFGMSLLKNFVNNF